MTDPTTTAALSLEQKIDALLAKLEAKGKADEASISGYVKKYWPIAAGILIAATRLIH